jgi:putative ABC transport system permease protein
MLLLAFRNLVRRPLRNGLAVGGLAAGVVALVCLLAFGNGYRRGLQTELDRMGLQLMLVPLGCPYDAAARVLKGKTLENSLPEAALEEARRDPAVAVAAPLLMASWPRPGAGRADLWVGLDETALELKPWWHARAGEKWFTSGDSVVLGCDAAEAEMRSPGDLFYSPEAGRKLRVVGVLERSGTSDDNLFFVPLRTAQEMFGQPRRLTAVAIRLRDPARLREAGERLQQIPGAQVVTLTEMMGTFLNLVGAVRTLLLSLALVAISVSVLGVFNTLLAAVVERTNELSVLRALGASRLQVFGLVSTEALLLAVSGTALGLLLAVAFGPGLEHLMKELIPMAPASSLFLPGVATLAPCLGIGLVTSLAAGVYPAWRAGRVQPATALNS